MTNLKGLKSRKNNIENHHIGSKNMMTNHFTCFKTINFFILLNSFKIIFQISYWPEKIFVSNKIWYLLFLSSQNFRAKYNLLNYDMIYENLRLITHYHSYQCIFGGECMIFSKIFLHLNSKFIPNSKQKRGFILSHN